MPSASPFLTCFELGSEKSEHPIKAWNKWGNLILGVLLTGAGVAALLIAVMSASIATGLVFLACLGLGGWCLWSAWNDWGQAAAVFDRGIAVARGEDVREIPWEEVTAVWQAITRHHTYGIHTGTTYLYSMQLADDTIYKFDGRYKDIEALGKAIQTSVTNMLYPKYIAALKAGSRLEFGPLALDYNKLYSGKKELSWDEVKSVKIQGGYVSVKKDKGWLRWASAGVPQIPNFFILYALLKEFGLVE